MRPPRLEERRGKRVPEPQLWRGGGDTNKDRAATRNGCPNDHARYIQGGAPCSAPAPRKPWETKKLLHESTTARRLTSLALLGAGLSASRAQPGTSALECSNGNSCGPRTMQVRQPAAKGKKSNLTLKSHWDLPPAREMATHQPRLPRIVRKTLVPKTQEVTFTTRTNTWLDSRGTGTRLKKGKRGAKSRKHPISSANGGA